MERSKAGSRDADAAGTRRWACGAVMEQGGFSCVLMGGDSLLAQCGEMLQERGHSIRAVVTREPSLEAWAARHSIAIVPPGVDLPGRLAGLDHDWLFSITNLSIVPEAVLATARHGGINFHDGPLPRYAGLRATSWAILNGETHHGVTWHRMSGDVDTGDILVQRTFPVADDETALTLNAKCYEEAIASFAELLDQLASGTLRPRRQDVSQRSYFARDDHPVAVCALDWRRPAGELEALVRALSFGRYPNPLGVAKTLVGDDVVLVTAARALPDPAGAEPGTVLSADGDVVVATGEGRLVLSGLLAFDGSPLPPERCRPGDVLRFPDEEVAAAMTRLHRRVGRHEEFWVERLAAPETVDLPYADRSAAGSMARAEAVHSLPLGGDDAVAAVAGVLARLTGKSGFDLAYSDPALRADTAGIEAVASTWVPLRVALDPTSPPHAALTAVAAELVTVRSRGTYLHDVAVRYPQLSGGPSLPSVAVALADGRDPVPVAPHAELVVVVSGDGVVRWQYDPARYSRLAVATLQRQLETVTAALGSDEPLSRVSLLDDVDRRRLLVEWNDTGSDYPRRRCVHELIEAQVEVTPEAVAVVFEDVALTYDELNRRANQLARFLQARGVGPDVPVGLFLDRGIELVVAILAVHKAGGAYLPLDPTYPAHRLAFMVADAGVPVLLTQQHLLGRLPEHQAAVVCVDADWGAVARHDEGDLGAVAAAEDLAYVIYTSGSTGTPKGVMVEHRNVVNFFIGMDDRIPSEDRKVWLAVTSLSFDISVLELLWTLARGFTVVVQGEKTAGPQTSAPEASRRIAFSLSYFASDESGAGADKYRLLLEGARFADEHGFEAVWTPERHFHAFGGLYPNPSVISAALATVTQRVALRAGSCVLPLHSPVRVAEEWAVVDNLSAGRVGVSFASGWQPDDFVLRPENFAEAKQVLVRDLETVRRLWRGEPVDLLGPGGRVVSVRTLPRPVQPELPVWLTSAGNLATFEAAGQVGANILTHLLGQNVGELGDKLAAYRRAWRDAGHPGEGHVTLMLHTFVGDDEDAVRAVVREPMIGYLRSCMSLIRNFAWAFPAFRSRPKDGAGGDALAQLSPEESDALLEHAFERYFRTSGLFGAPERCLALVEELKGVGVDEIACLIDFGVDPELVLEHLRPLAALAEAANATSGAPSPAAEQEDWSIAAQIARHGVTHLQCTPSMAGMLLADAATRRAVAGLQVLMIGGEAFPPSLAADLGQLGVPTVINMYGPTETTIWSSTHEIVGAPASVPIGTPIANTQLYVLDDGLVPVPVGVPAELYIGGDGVTRGYLNRAELTAERFLPDPFRTGGRMYRTGDLVRWLRDGTVECLGRIDHQVKIRGYRVELGEIEAALVAHPMVRDAVVVAREDAPGDKRLVAYVIPADPLSPPNGELRVSLCAALPEFMVPSQFVVVSAFPLTPNGKIDRKSLPAPDRVAVDPGRVLAPAQSELEEQIAALWCDALNVTTVGATDNFFDLGGHSLLVVQVHRRLRELLGRDLPLTDLFRFPTVRALASALEGTEGREPAKPAARRGRARANLRRQLARAREGT